MSLRENLFIIHLGNVTVFFCLFVCLSPPIWSFYWLYDFRVLLSTFHLIIFYPRKEYIHGKYSCCFVKPLHKSMMTNM